MPDSNQDRPQDPRSGAIPANDAGEPRFDAVLGKLRTIVDNLERGELPLEDGLRLFEEGMTLCRQGAEILDRAEKRVEQLVSAPGKPTLAPFDVGSGRGDPERGP